MNKWISIEDRLPDYGEFVIVSDENGIVQRCMYALDSDEDGIDFWGDNYDMCDGFDVGFFTHWMPLPESP
ncbi:MAG: DUF551 domain-containing protein [Aeromonadaceae bacterium]